MLVEVLAHGSGASLDPPAAANPVVVKSLLAPLACFHALAEAVARGTPACDVEALAAKHATVLAAEAVLVARVAAYGAHLRLARLGAVYARLPLDAAAALVALSTEQAEAALREMIARREVAASVEASVAGAKVLVFDAAPPPREAELAEKLEAEMAASRSAGRRVAPALRFAFACRAQRRRLSGDAALFTLTLPLPPPPPPSRTSSASSSACDASMRSTRCTRVSTRSRRAARAAAVAAAPARLFT